MVLFMPWNAHFFYTFALQWLIILGPYSYRDIVRTNCNCLRVFQLTSSSLAFSSLVVSYLINKKKEKKKNLLIVTLAYMWQR